MPSSKMPSLIIPESGLSLASSREPSSKAGFGVPDVFGISLTDVVIEEMITCVQKGKPIQLSLGEHPSISYGSKLAYLATTIDDFTHELYHSNLPISNSKSASASLKMGTPQPNINKGIAKVENKPHPQFLAMFQNKKLKVTVTKTTKATPNQTSVSSTNKSDMATAFPDAALAQLQNSLASENLKKQENTIKYIKDGSGLPGPGRKGGPASKVTNKSKFLSQNSRGGDTTRSMPSSPNLVGMGSPLVGPTSVPLSQQNADKAKTARKPIVHLLALGPVTKKELREKIDEVPDQEFENVLTKVGDLNESTGKYELRKNFFKELDVWTFKYDSSEDRQKAIDNAVKTYDKMRLGLSEPEWDRLLVKAERGTGKHLSKLQAQIAAGPIARPPKINVEKVEGSGRDTPSGKDEDSFSDKNITKVKGESMSRSISQPPNTKTKKVGEKEAQTKRLLSKNPSKAAPANKPAPTKKAPQSKTSSKVLSSEFVNDSDEDDDCPQATKPVAKPSIKRSREEDDVETSDSSVPLAKKVKKETPSSHRISDASQSSRTTHTSHYSSGSSKKDTSPQKSSPLASSPPTNASEFENSSSGGRTSSSTSPAHHPSIKNTRSPIHKRHQKSSSVASSTSSSSSTRYLKPEVMDIARKYKMYYPSYETLHRELMEIGEHRDKGKEALLLEMHERLAGMKAQIMAGIVMEDTN